VSQALGEFCEQIWREKGWLLEHMEGVPRLTAGVLGLDREKPVGL